METEDNNWWCGTPYIEKMLHIKRQEFGGPSRVYSEDIINRLEKLGYEVLEDIPTFVIYLKEEPTENRIKGHKNRGRIVYNGVGNELLKKTAHKLVNENLQYTLDEFLEDLRSLYKLLIDIRLEELSTEGEYLEIDRDFSDFAE